jgi:hypothetical protein
LDKTAAAEAVLARVQVIEHYLTAAQGNDPSAGDLHLALYQSLLLATNVHQLAIIDNERSIVAQQESVEGASLGGRSRSAKKRNRNREMAQEFLNRRGRSSMSDTALMASIGAKEDLQRRASVNAVKRGLKDLKGD